MSADGALRFAVLCDGGPLDGWAASAIDHLLTTPGIIPAAFLVTGARSPQPRARVPLLFRLYTARTRRRAAAEAVDLAAIAPAVPRLQADEDAARALDLDFVLSLHTDLSAVSLADATRYGLWAFDFDRDSSAPASAGEVSQLLRGETVLSAALLRVGPRVDGATVLREGWFRADAARPLASIARARLDAARWPAAVAGGLRRAIPLREPPDARPVPGRSAPAVPATLQTARLGALYVRHLLLAMWRHAFRHPQWNIGIVDRPIHELVGGTARPPVRWFPLTGRKGFLADPFGVQRGSTLTVLCEYFDYRLGKGIVARVEVADGVFRAPAKPVLALPEHLSYPCVVEDGRDVYCIPEILGSREVTLFKADPTLRRWIRDDVLLRDVAAVDPTVTRHAGRWWLMFVDGDGAPDANLVVWHAHDLRGPWAPHALNPVKVDVRSARPAGPLFVHDGRLYRPAQDCSRRYGTRVVLHEVTRLTPDDFDERIVGAIEPSPGSPYPAGRHTVAGVGDVTLVDGHRFVFVGTAALHYLRILLRNLVA